ncbi:MAG: cytochrome-c peroxidase [Burkholderiales bacterium]|nr:cytochrome-c peroxidase [Burkholderiales bacterium]
MKIHWTRVVVSISLFSLLTGVYADTVGGDRWSAAEIEQISSLSLRGLDALPPDPTNRVADDPRAVILGQRLFFDVRLSSNGRVSCATCHLPDREFQDGTPLASGVGATNRRTMPIAATAHSPFLFWDGRKDSQWSQALGPLESPVEHGGTRAQYAHVIAANYRADYERIFGILPNLENIPLSAGPVPDAAAAKSWEGLSDAQRNAVTGVYVNIGKAIAAYERRIQYRASRFDRYVDGLRQATGTEQSALRPDEVAGLRLFIGKANCTQCHNGPLLTNNEFHNTGVPAGRGLSADEGRLAGANSVLRDEFNCRSRWSDANRAQCAELEYLVTDAHTLQRAFKVPSLRNVAERAPYMHAGQLATLRQVLDHYNRAPEAPAGHSEVKPLRLSALELRQLEAFLRTLSGGTTAPPMLPSVTALNQNR